MNTHDMNAETMNTRSRLHRPLAIGLGVLALIRPAVSIVESVIGISDPAAVPILITIGISAVWIAVVGLRSVARPVLTLVLAGVTYGVLVIVVSGIVSPIMSGHLEGPLSNPIAIVPVLLVNAVWGLVAGAPALLLQRARGHSAASGTNA